MEVVGLPFASIMRDGEICDKLLSAELVSLSRASGQESCAWWMRQSQAG